LIAAGGIPKPVFNVFKMLHGLGEERLDADSQHALLTRRTDGSLVIALWNYAAPGEAGAPSDVILQLRGLSARSAKITRLDADHGDAHGEYVRLGSPRYPSRAQLDLLAKAAALPAPSQAAFSEGRLPITLPPNGLAIVEIAPPAASP
jgi:xylan 1,4-beta-xylosidase